MKKWENAELLNLSIEATANQPTAEIAVDDLINGVFTFGKRDLTSGQTAGEIIYTPTN